MASLKPKHIVLASVALLFIASLVAIGGFGQTGELTSGDGVVTKVIGTAEANTAVSFSIRTIEGTDAEHESTHMFEALEVLAGISEASLDTEGLTLTVTYDDLAIDAGTIRSHLVNAGYIAPVASDGTAAALSEDGSSQSAYLGDSGYGFDPNVVFAASGVPLSLEFAPGQACRTSVSLPALGIAQDISEGGTVQIPALDPGEYYILCGGGAQEGLLIVE
ncbi:MAG: hypothetical protein JXE06_07875 [Coriobacteriia bacterium]|nr:hypothetical protein [Coriobacteriia bacterium]MBN2822313.1 hypothetical protein [Coriobacteriia bacterium]